MASPAYTIGQRKGLGVAVGEKRFVTGIDPELNVITIGPEEHLLRDVADRRERELGRRRARRPDARAAVKIRYRTPAAPATVTPLAGSAPRASTFDAPQRAITPGQAAVFYDGDEVLGGGAILRADANRT